MDDAATKWTLQRRWLGSFLYLEQACHRELTDTHQQYNTASHKQPTTTQATHSQTHSYTHSHKCAGDKQANHRS